MSQAEANQLMNNNNVNFPLQESYNFFICHGVCHYSSVLSLMFTRSGHLQDWKILRKCMTVKIKVNFFVISTKYTKIQNGKANDPQCTVQQTKQCK